jgi:hypothetical protein
MARTHNIDGVRVDFTQDEEDALDAVDAAWTAAKPLQVWHDDMAETDHGMTRTMEDMLDGMPDKSGVAQITLDKLQTKKDLRATKP